MKDRFDIAWPWADATYPRRFPRQLFASRGWRSLRFAVEGLREAWRTQPNLRLHLYAAVGVIAVGVWVRLLLMEWVWISVAIGLVIFAELMNTAIEHTVDLVVGLRPDPLARSIKDLAAGCVLVAASLAVLIGVFTLTPHVLAIIG